MFIKSEDGAVTVDWVVLTAASAGMGIAVSSVVTDGIETTTDRIAKQLAQDTQVTSSFEGSEEKEAQEASKKGAVKEEEPAFENTWEETVANYEHDDPTVSDVYKTLAAEKDPTNALKEYYANAAKSLESALKSGDYKTAQMQLDTAMAYALYDMKEGTKVDFSSLGLTPEEAIRMYEESMKKT